MQQLKKIRICRAFFPINLYTSKFKYIDYVITMLIIRFILDFKAGIEAKIKEMNEKEKNEKNKNVNEKLS